MSQAVASWSGGKDSCLACYKAILKGLQVSHLLNMITEDGTRSCSHGLKAELIVAQAEAMGIPCLQRKTTMETYEQEFKQAIGELKRKGVKGGVFGDIDFAEHREWVDRICWEMDIRAFLPLWGIAQEQVLADFIASGFEAVIVAVNTKFFGEDWLGRIVDTAFVDHLLELSRGQEITLCGEAGEYHTFVIDGPLFKKRVKIVDSRKVLRDGYWFLDIPKWSLE
jgi:uncharacterized protein (TIGR00290 family)